jgi:hypothetical protein
MGFIIDGLVLSKNVDKPQAKEWVKFSSEEISRQIRKNRSLILFFSDTFNNISDVKLYNRLGALKQERNSFKVISDRFADLYCGYALP